MTNQELAKKAVNVRRNILKMTNAAKCGHPGGSMSAVEILLTIYGHEMDITKENVTSTNRDRFVLSKGHAAPVLYSVLSEFGYIEEKDLLTLRKLHSKLQGHPNMNYIDAVDMSTGSLGQGISAAVGMALSNKKVVLLYYSTFAQRAYDQILNDIARQDLGVIIGIDRAGVVGEDGVTHQGIYDISMFMGMPNVIITMPKDSQELIGMFNYAFTLNKPFIIRYPKKNEIVDLNNLDYDYQIDNTWEVLKEGNDTCIISYGPDLIRYEKLIKDNNLNVGLVNARFIKPIDEVMLKKLFGKYNKIIVIEQVVNNGSLYSLILDYYNKNNININVKSINFNVDTLLPHGKVEEVLNDYGLSDEDILNIIK